MSAQHLLLFAAIGYAFFVLDKKQQKLPVPLLLVVTGALLAFIPFFKEITVGRTLIYEGFLPALLFISAYRFSYSSLKKYGSFFGSLSTIGLMLVALLLGCLIWFSGSIFTSIPFAAALLIASILTPTDPVSVESVLEESSINKKYTSVLEGESMINDGTSVVIFTIVSSMYVSNSSFSLLHFLKEFVLVSAGGVLIGFVMGWILSKNIYLLDSHSYRVMVSLVIAYGSFYLAEAVGVSGVLATVTSGIMFSYELQRSGKEDTYRKGQEGFWSVIEPTILSFVFLTLGVVSMQYIQWNQILLFVGIFVLSVIVRYMIIAIFSMLKKSWRQTYGGKGSIILSLAGVRGTMSVVLLLTLQAEISSNDHYILSLSFGAVLLSLIIQSFVVYPLSKTIKN